MLTKIVWVLFLIGDSCGARQNVSLTVGLGMNKLQVSDSEVGEQAFLMSEAMGRRATQPRRAL